jgi:hypothetical protein
MGAAAMLAVCGVAAGTPPFSIEALVLEGDGVEGVGLATRIDLLAVNNKGEWLVEADTDNADTDADSVMLKNGSLLLREGDPIDVPTGGTINGFDAVNLNLFGHSGWNIFLADTGGLSTDSGMFYDDVLVFQESTISEAEGFTDGTPYIGFFDSKMNDHDQILIMASVDDPAIPSSVDRALVRVDYDAGKGTYTETVLGKEGDILPGQVEAVADYGTDPDEFDWNNAGDVMFIADLEGDAAFDLALYLNDELLAQEGFASPVEGRNWQSFGSASVAINNLGAYAYRADLDGDTADDLVIVAGGEVFVREGDAAPDGQPLMSFGSSPDLNDAGEVLWVAVWDDVNGAEVEALMLDDAVLVQTGVTEIDGSLVTDLGIGEDHFFTSSNGNFVIFEATLATGQEGAFLVSLCAADFNRDGTLSILDFVAMQNAFTSGNPRADINNDGAANILDFVAYQNLFQAGCE